MPILGPRALIDIALPTGVDATEIFRFSMENGMTGEEAIAMAATVIGQVNERWMSTYGGLVYNTESQYARYRNGTASAGMTPEHAEGWINDPVRADLIGHMLPRRDYQDTLSWTRQWLRRADREMMRADLDLISDRWWNRLRVSLWTRLLTNDENAIGSAGYDVPWAIGTGTNVNFIPPQNGAYTFDSTHTHFKFYDDTSLGWNNVFDGLMLELRHHGYMGTITIWVSSADLAEVLADTPVPGVARLERSNIIVVGGNTSSPVRYAVGDNTGMPGELFAYYSGIYGTAELRFDVTIPTNYAFATVTYGVNNPQNAVAVRTEPGMGFGLRVVPQLDRSPERQLDYLLFETTFGIGVNDRTKGVAGYLAAGAASWVDPTIA